MLETTDSSAGPPASPPSNDRRRDLLIGILLFVGGMLAFADVLFGFRSFYLRDLTRYYYPAKRVLRDIVFGGEFPYWNRLFSAGQPIAANPEHEVFYPPTWLILFPDYDVGYRLLVLLHVGLGLVAMYALLRSMDLRWQAAVFGAITWGFGGLYMSYVNLLPILFCAAWLPLTCLYLRRFLLGRRIRDLALASLFLGIQCLVGEPTTVFQTGLLLGFYALYRGWYSERPVLETIRNVAYVGLVSIFGVLIGAAQAIPAIDHVGDSARSRTFPFDLVSAWSMPWAKLAELLFPNILGHMAINGTTWYWAGGLYPGMASPFIFNAYCGILMIALAIGGAFARPRGGRLVLIVVTISVALALGNHTPLLRWLYDAGIAGAVRYPEKFILAGLFAVIVFSAMMFQRLVDGDRDVRDGALGFAAAVFLVAATVAILAFTPLYAETLSKIWSLTPGANRDFIVKVSRNDWIGAALRAAIALGLVASVRVRYRRVWIAATLVFALADILPIANEINPRMPRHFFDRPALAASLPENRDDYRVFHEADWYGQENTAKQFFSTGRAVYWIVRNGLYPMTPAGWDFQTVMERDYDKTALLPTLDLVDSVWDVKRSGRADWYVPFMAMGNAWFRMEYRVFDQERKRVNGDMRKAIAVKPTPGPRYPRYYFAEQVVPIKDRADFVKKLTSSTWPASVAFVQSKALPVSPGIVHRVAETANTATLDVESRGPGFLVMSVTPHKYWRITLDGREIQAMPTNLGYQGIAVPAGRHQVKMVYRNTLVPIGLGVTAGATLILGLGTLTRRTLGNPPAPRTPRPAAAPPPEHSEEIADIGAPAQGPAEPPAPES